MRGTKLKTWQWVVLVGLGLPLTLCTGGMCVAGFKGAADGAKKHAAAKASASAEAQAPWKPPDGVVTIAKLMVDPDAIKPDSIDRSGTNMLLRNYTTIPGWSWATRGEFKKQPELFGINLSNGTCDENHFAKNPQLIGTTDGHTWYKLQDGPLTGRLLRIGPMLGSREKCVAIVTSPGYARARGWGNEIE